MMHWIIGSIFITVALISGWSFIKTPAKNIGLENGKLKHCPNSPNCVSTDDHRPDHHVAPLTFSREVDQVWEELKTVIKEMNGVIIQGNRTYLHAEFTSRFMRFVDDVECNLRPDQKIIAIKSASRTGYSDLNINRKRMEELRLRLKNKGVIDS